MCYINSFSRNIEWKLYPDFRCLKTFLKPNKNVAKEFLKAHSLKYSMNTCLCAKNILQNLTSEYLIKICKTLHAL